MEAWRIQALISFHKAGLQEHRFAMSPAAVQLEEETIKALEELRNPDERIATLTAQRDEAIKQGGDWARKAGQLEQKLNDVVERHTT